MNIILPDGKINYISENGMEKYKFASDYQIVINNMF